MTDYRGRFFTASNEDIETVIDWTFYPAYLIPADIEVGERVFIKDLIEDYVAASWNQGDVYRLESCEVIWNGSDLEIQYDPIDHRSDYMG